MKLFTRNTNRRSKLRFRHLIAFIGLFSILGCFGGLDCNPSKESGPGIIHGLSVESASGPWTEKNQTYGEPFYLPIAVTLLPGETAGENVVVTPFVPGGCSFTPAQITAKLPANGNKTYVRFAVNITDTATPDLTLIGANRTTALSGAAQESTYDDAPLNIVRNLVSVTLSPTSATAALHQAKTFTLSILPRGITEGPVELFLGMDDEPHRYNLSTDKITVNMVRGSTTPIVQTFTVTPVIPGNVSRLEIKMDSRTTLARAPITIGTGNGTPEFQLTATPLEVSAPSGGLTQDVLFVLVSKNGFSGPVKITWVVDGSVEPQPADQDVVHNLTPAQSVQFVRKFRRMATHNIDIPITFNATDDPFTMQKSVTINVKQL